MYYTTVIGGYDILIDHLSTYFCRLSFNFPLNVHYFDCLKMFLEKNFNQVLFCVVGHCVSELIRKAIFSEEECETNSNTVYSPEF